MNKLSLLTSFFMVLTFSGMAQEGEFRIGFQMSPRFSWLSTNIGTVTSSGTNLGIHIGTMSEFYFSDNYAVTMGLGLTFNQGGTLKHKFGGNFLPESDLSESRFNEGIKPLADGVEIKYKLQYLEIPMSLKLRTREFGYTRFFIEAPMLSWGIRTQARGDINTVGIKTEKENIREDVSIFVFSWGLGGGLEYFFSEKNSLVGGIFYNRGFNDITTNKGTTAMTNPEQDPNNPDDDYITSKEDSKAVQNMISVKIGIFF